MKYEDAGVNISKADAFVEKIKLLAQGTLNDFVLEGIGPFASLVELKDYKNPVLVSGTDGVGTKLKIAFMMNKHDTVGIDLVAMCVNDVITTGAKPLFFLDYFACGKLDETIGVNVIKGIAQGCTMAKCALVGGETAEMPSFYPEGEYDLAGFCVGVAEKEELIDPEMVSVGDAVIGLASSGLHSNGYSLVRKILFEQHHYNVSDDLPQLGKTLGDELLTPTLIYVRAFEQLQGLPIKAAAHITGGGLLENLPRVLPEGTAVKLYKDSWTVPPIFTLLQELGEVEVVEMYRTFNMGIGMVLIIPQQHASEAINRINAAADYKAQIIGEVVPGDRQVILP